MPTFVSLALGLLNIIKALTKTLVLLHGLVRDERYLVGQELINNTSAAALPTPPEAEAAD